MTNTFWSSICQGDPVLRQRIAQQIEKDKKEQKEETVNSEMLVQELLPNGSTKEFLRPRAVPKFRKIKKSQERISKKKLQGNKIKFLQNNTVNCI